MAGPQWFENLRGMRLVGLAQDGKTPKEMIAFDKSGNPVIPTSVDGLDSILGPAKNNTDTRLFLLSDTPVPASITAGLVTVSQTNWAKFIDFPADAKSLTANLKEIGISTQDYIVLAVNAYDDYVAEQMLTHNLNSKLTEYCFVLDELSDFIESFNEPITSIYIAAIGSAAPVSDNGLMLTMSIK